MLYASLDLPQQDTQKLLCAANGDAALLYLYLRSGNSPAKAGEDLALGEGRVSCALATLRQLGLVQEKQNAPVFSGQRPAYSETDVLTAMDHDGSFRALYGEVQRVLGRTLNTEELKILLGLQNYLGLEPEVISVLVTYCRERARQQGRVRPPSLRTIEKEAYAWAEQGIDSMEEAAAYIQAQNLRRSRLGRLMQILQISGRSLTATEEKYANSWLEMGFDDEALSLAYDRTCVNTGSMKWAYMNGILKRWHESGLHTGRAVSQGDRRDGEPISRRGLDELERSRLAQLFGEE